MDKYSGSNVKSEVCPKCGATGDGKIAPEIVSADDPQITTPGQDEIQLKCLVCNYAWRVLPLDAPEA